MFRELLQESTTVPIDTKVDQISEEQHAIDSIILLIFLMMLILTMLVIWRFKIRRYRFLHETGASIIIGLLVGLIMNSINPRTTPREILCNATARASMDKAITNVEEEAVFDPEIFFYVLLAPIIFNAGYSLKRKHFFRNIGTILTYAFVGTTLATFITGYLVFAFVKYIQPSNPLSGNESLQFGALISATDPVTVLAIFNDLHVDSRLYALVFGESVLNDAVAIVLYRTISEYKPGTGDDFTASSFFLSLLVFFLIFFGSFACGVLVGMLSALFFKFTSIREFPLLETILFILFSYMSFLLGEGFGLTGIVSILFCGITQAHYTYHNLSPQSKHSTKEFFELLNFMGENFIFAYIGCHQWNGPFIGWALFAIILARTVAVIPLTFLSNLVRRRGSPKIGRSFQFMLIWAGLRGAIAVALAMRNVATEAHQLILSTTLVIVLVTVLCFGGTTVAVLQWLKIQVGIASDDDEEEEGDAVPGRLSLENSTAQPTIDIEQMDETTHREKFGFISYLWTSMDENYLYPMFVRLDGVKDFGTHTSSQLWTTIKTAFSCKPPQLAPMPTISASSAYSSEESVDSDPTTRNAEHGRGSDTSSDEDMLNSGDLGDLAAWALNDD